MFVHSIGWGVGDTAGQFVIGSNTFLQRIRFSVGSGDRVRFWNQVGVGPWGQLIGGSIGVNRDAAINDYFKF